MVRFRRRLWWTILAIGIGVAAWRISRFFILDNPEFSALVVGIAALTLVHREYQRRFGSVETQETFAVWRRDAVRYGEKVREEQRRASSSDPASG